MSKDFPHSKSIFNNLKDSESKSFTPPVPIQPSDRYIPLRSPNENSHFSLHDHDWTRSFDIWDSKHFSSNSTELDSLVGRKRNVLSFSRTKKPTLPLSPLLLSSSPPIFEAAKFTSSTAPQIPYKEFNTQGLADLPGIEHLDWSQQNQICFVVPDRIVFYSPEKKHKLQSLFSSPLSSLKFCPTGDFLSVLECSGRVKLFDVKEQKIVSEFSPFLGQGVGIRWINPLVFLVVSSLGLSTQIDLRCKLAENLKSKYSLISNFKNVNCFDFSAANQRTAFGTSDGNIVVRDLRMHDPTDLFIKVHKFEVGDLSFNPVLPSNIVSCGGTREKQIILTNIYNNSIIKKVNVGSMAREIQFSKKDEFFLLGHFGKRYNYSIGVWSRECKIIKKLEPQIVKKTDFKSSEIVSVEENHNEVVNLCFSPDSKEFVCTYASDKIKIWKTEGFVEKEKGLGRYEKLVQPR